MNEAYCQYNGCKEVADYILNIQYLKQDYVLACTKHTNQLNKKINLKKKRLKLTDSMRKILRNIRNIKNISIFIELKKEEKHGKI